MERFTIEQVVELLNKLFNDHPDGQDAKTFLHHYGIYCHNIDDIVDEHVTEPEVILNTHMQALKLFSSNFYRKYQDVLYPCIINIHHTWLDSVAMESSSELWQKEQADVLRLVGIEIKLVVIELLGGYEARRKCSVAVRENTYKKQHDIFELNK